MSHPPDAPEHRPLPDIAFLALLVRGEDASRVAAAFDISCSDVKAYVRRAATSFIERYSEANSTAVSTPSDLASIVTLVAIIRRIVRIDPFNAFGVLTPSELVELSEATAYYRAFCNSPVQMKEQHHGQV